jgi:FkbM family methyltransferase
MIEYTKESHQWFKNQFLPYVKENDWCIDIGANIGCTCLPLSELVGINGKVICFEPSIESLKQLKPRTSNLLNIDLHEVACSNKYSKLQLNYNNIDNGDIIDDSEGFTYERRFNIPSTLYDVNCVDTCNFLIKSYNINDFKNKLRFIKIDTEGYDYVILKNLKPLLDICHPIIYIEWWCNEDKNDLLFDSIDTINYTPYRIDNMLLTNRTQFNNKCTDLILKPAT